MKKIIAGIVVCVIMVSNVCAFATEDQYAESTLTYTADDQFYISVPENTQCRRRKHCNCDRG